MRWQAGSLALMPRSCAPHELEHPIVNVVLCYHINTIIYTLGFTLVATATLFIC